MSRTAHHIVRPVLGRRAPWRSVAIVDLRYSAACLRQARQAGRRPRPMSLRHRADVYSWARADPRDRSVSEWADLEERQGSWRSSGARTRRSRTRIARRSRCWSCRCPPSRRGPLLHRAAERAWRAAAAPAAAGRAGAARGAAAAAGRRADAGDRRAAQRARPAREGAVANSSICCGSWATSCGSRWSASVPGTPTWRSALMTSWRTGSRRSCCRAGRPAGGEHRCWPASPPRSRCAAPPTWPPRRWPTICWPAARARSASWPTLLTEAAVAAIESGEEAINQRTLLLAGYAGPTERRRKFERELL